MNTVSQDTAASANAQKINTTIQSFAQNISSKISTIEIPDSLKNLRFNGYTFVFSKPKVPFLVVGCVCQ